MIERPDSCPGHNGTPNYLPFQFSFLKRSSCEIKMMSNWSISSNTLQHRLVQELCLDVTDHMKDLSEAKMNRGLAFVDIAAKIYAVERMGTETVKLAKRFVEMNPQSCRLQRIIGKLDTAKEINERFMHRSPANRYSNTN